MNSGRYMVALPDIGEYERSAAGNDEIVLSVPKSRMEEFVTGLLEREQGKLGPVPSTPMMVSDFPSPTFYQMLFARWGLDGKE